MRKFETFIGACSKYIDKQGWTTQIPVEQIKEKGYQKVEESEIVIKKEEVDLLNFKIAHLEEFCSALMKQISMMSKKESPCNEQKREDFLNALCDIAEYWKDKEDSTFGAIFSTLVMFDGDNSLNDFEKLEIVGISNKHNLHDDFCRIRNERNNL